MNDSPLEIVKKRIGGGYGDKIIDDEYKVGIAFEAGGFSSVVSLAMSDELDQAGVLEHVDGFYGLSSGGVNAAYSAADQIHDGLHTYTQIMTNEKFVNFGRAFRKPIADISLLEKVLHQYHPLDTASLVSDKSEVVVGVTRLEDYKPIIVSSKLTNPEELADWLTRGCHLPLLSGEPPTDGKYHYADGTLSWYSPTQLAIEDGCTHVINLANQTNRQHKTPRLVRSIVGDWIEQYSPRANSSYEQFCIDKEVAINDSSQEIQTKYGAFVLRCFPEDISDLPGLLTSDKRKLRRGIWAGRRAAQYLLKDF